LRCGTSTIVDVKRLKVKHIPWGSLGNTDTNSSLFLFPIEIRKCLLSFGAETFVFRAAIQKLKD